MESAPVAGADHRWLLFIHHIPPQPSYFRVKTWRRLQRLGAVAIKNSVYVLPKRGQAHEDLQWLRCEIVKGGGDASICEGRFVDGLSDDAIEVLFRSARDSDYAQLADEVRRLAETLSPALRLERDRAARVELETARLRRRLAEIVAIDFFRAPGRDTAEGLLADLEARLRPAAAPAGEQAIRRAAVYRNRVWVTRRGVHVDRIASAWLIRRFVDRHARFKFVAAKGYRPRAGEHRFDMFEAEFTHEGDRCTFEVLIDRFGLADGALQPLAEMVHDIDLKDAKFRRPETVGLERLIAGIAMAHKDDAARLARGAAVFEDLYEYFRRRPA